VLEIEKPLMLVVIVTTETVLFPLFVKFISTPKKLSDLIRNGELTSGFSETVNPSSGPSTFSLREVTWTLGAAVKL